MITVCVLTIVIDTTILRSIGYAAQEYKRNYDDAPTGSALLGFLIVLLITIQTYLIELPLFVIYQNDLELQLIVTHYVSNLVMYVLLLVLGYLVADHIYKNVVLHRLYINNEEESKEDDLK